MFLDEFAALRSVVIDIVLSFFSQLEAAHHPEFSAGDLDERDGQFPVDRKVEAW